MSFVKNKLLFLILFLYFILAVNYSLNVPIFEAPDEPDHFEFVKYLVKYQRLPFLKEKISTEPATAVHPPLYYILSAFIYSPLKAFDHPVEVTYNEKFGLVNRNRYFHQKENIAEHYPFYIIRLFSIVLGMGTIVFGWKIAGECFGENKYLTILSASLIAFIPQFIYINGSINNDNLANFISTVLFWLLIKTAGAEEHNRRDIILTGICLGLAGITKFTVLFLLPLAVIVLYIIKKNKTEYFNNVLILTFFIGIISGWFYIRNYLLYDNALGLKFMIKRSLLSFYFIKPFANISLFSFFGLFGWMNILMDKIIYIFYMLFYGAGIFAALKYALGKRPSLLDKYPKIKIHCLIMFLGIALSLISNIRHNMTQDDYQGRHLFPVIAPFAVLVVLGYYYIYSGIKEKYKISLEKNTKTIFVCLIVIVFVSLNIFIVNVYLKQSFAGAFL